MEFIIRSRCVGGSYYMSIITAKQVEKKLRERVKGYVTVHISGDTLVCDINRHDIWYRFTQPNIAQLLHEGLQSELIVNTIHKDYKIFLNKRFFK